MCPSSLVEDEADLAIVTGPKLPHARFVPALTESFCVIRRKNHPLGDRPLTLE